MLGIKRIEVHCPNCYDSFTYEESTNRVAFCSSSVSETCPKCMREGSPEDNLLRAMFGETKPGLWTTKRDKAINIL